MNLSAFETFFSERRPFFVEGSGIFQLDIDCNDGSCSGLFYSRRIGRSPRGSATVPDGGYLERAGADDDSRRRQADGPARRVFGRRADRGHIRRERGHRQRVSENPPGDRAADRIQRHPRAARVREPVVDRFHGHRDEPQPGQCHPLSARPGVHRRARLRLAARTASTPSRDFSAGSSVRGDAAAIDELQRNNVHSFQRPDSTTLHYDPTRTSLNGYGGSARFTKIGGQRVRFFSSVGVKSPGFEINDLGFMQRADPRTMSNWMQVRYETPSKYLRSFRYNLNQWAGWNYDGDLLQSGGNVNAHSVFPNNWGTGMGVNVNARSFDDRATRGGPGRVPKSPSEPSGATSAATSGQRSQATSSRRRRRQPRIDVHGDESLGLVPAVLVPEDQRLA